MLYSTGGLRHLEHHNFPANVLRDGLGAVEGGDEVSLLGRELALTAEVIMEVIEHAKYNVVAVA